jgi:MFS family permease
MAILPPPYDRLLLPIYLPSLLMAVSHQAIFLLLPLYALELSGSVAFAAIVMGLRGFGLLLFDVPAGVLVGKLGSKLVLFGGLATIAVVMLLLAAASNQWVVALLVVPLGAAHAAWFLGWLSHVTATCSPDERGRATSAIAGIQRFGAFIGPLVGGVIAQGFGYSTAFFVGGVIAATAAVLSFLFTNKIDTPKAKNSDHLKTIRMIFRSNKRIFSTAGSVALIFQFMRAVRQLLIPLFGVIVGLDAAAIGLIYAISAAVDMSMFYPVGVAMDRWGRKWTGIPSMVVFIIGFVTLPFSQGFYSLLLSGALLGFANGLSVGLVQIIGMDLSPADVRGEFLGVWRLISDAGWAAGPLLAGVMVDIASLSAASFSTAGLGFFGGVVYLFMVPETLKLSRERIKNKT